MHKRITAENGFETLEISNEAAQAKIALQGAQLFEYARYGEPALLWVSPTAVFENGRAVRGGVPLCWPWFGKDPAYPDRPQHGFVRTAPWTLERIEEPDDLLTVVTLTLDHTQVEQPYFPYRFHLMARIAVGETLTVSLTTENRDDVPFEITEALHTYFNVGNITAVSITGLEGVAYADALEAFAFKSSSRPISILQEVDRVYLDTKDIVILQDERFGRNIIVGKEGSRSTVVWNPWIDKAARLSDFDDEGYTSMVCIETANALRNSVTVTPGESHTITQTVR